MVVFRLVKAVSFPRKYGVINGFQKKRRQAMGLLRTPCRVTHSHFSASSHPGKPGREIGVLSCFAARAGIIKPSW